MKRARSNDGTRSHVEQAVPLRGGLIYSVLGVTRYERKPLQVYHGPKPAGRGPRCSLTDEQFLRIRALHKFGCMPPSKIVDVTGVPRPQIDAVLTYTTRVHLEPRAEHVAESKAAA